MGLIYKVGNTIQALPFPDKSRLSTTGSILLSTLIALFLAFFQWKLSLVAHSVALSVIGTLQIAITLLLSLFFVIASYKDRIKSQRFRFLYLFLAGFFISLVCGYLFFDAFDHFHLPLFQYSSGLLLSSIITILGNIFIIQILSKAKVTPFKVKALQVPFFSIIIFSILYIGVLLLANNVNWLYADSILGLLAALAVFAWACITFLDAYWHMMDLSQDTIP